MADIKPASKPFPIPIRVIGPGSQVEDDTLDYMVMPRGMSTWQAPSLPEPEAVAALGDARVCLHRVAAALGAVLDDARHRTLLVPVAGLDAANRALLHQVLGEGEVAVRIDADGRALRVQESVYAGVWRVLGDGVDAIEVGLAPNVLLDTAPAAAAAVEALAAPDAALPAEVMNAPAILAELAEHLRRWTPGRAAQVINLTLLPLSPGDLDYLGERLGSGGTTILSRGYGNCRVTRTALAPCWQVVYYNSQDQVILNTLEVGGVPDVVCAAVEDLHDSRERLVEALHWLEGAA
ncbi:hydrogenase expression/formation protein [Solimonas flava]|uniref:hydrogenase expression/formation protein n=1 Tax=Solimonas flava TaxID=415849 RepID=UPI00041D6DC5|nr:hydrogenase expression/formation protein [Solimonas flava]